MAFPTDSASQSVVETSPGETDPAAAEYDSSSHGRESISGVNGNGSGPTGRDRRRSRRWDSYVLYNIALPILLLLVGIAVYVGLGKDQAASVPTPQPTRANVLETLTATRVEPIRSLAETGRGLELVVDGTVVPFREAAVSSEVAGQIISKSDRCEAGAIVKRGEVLMRIDPTDYELEVERLSRLREQEYRALGELDQEMENTRRTIEVAKEEVQLQQKEVDRLSKLKTFASQSEVDRARSGLLKARQSLLQMENTLNLLGARRSRLEASEQLAVAQLRAAETNLRRCEIKAPIDGVVVSEQADVNTLVSRGTPLLTIEDTSRVEVAASMRMSPVVLPPNHEYIHDARAVPRARTGRDSP